MLDTLFAPYAGGGELILRLALGIVFLAHGLPKLENPAELTGLLRKLGMPGARLLAWLVAVLETAGAVLLILGVATPRISSTAPAVSSTATSHASSRAPGMPSFLSSPVSSAGFSSFGSPCARNTIPSASRKMSSPPPA